MLISTHLRRGKSLLGRGSQLIQALSGLGSQSYSAKLSASKLVLDVAGGTGDIAFRIAKEMQKSTSATSPAQATEPPRLVVCDINKAMLEQGRLRAEREHKAAAQAAAMEWVTGDAEQLPFEDNAFDVYTIAFGIRNVTHIDRALAEARRVLRPGGRFLCLEFSQVTNPMLRAAYERYSFEVIPKIGAAVANDRASYQYLVESIRRFPDQETFSQMIRDSGLRCVQHTNLTNGVVAIHSAVKLG
uniref:2-methoxy-6-polyprenyl-1,4-benzoquinol methylase, mitochondrial n=1 Tax=Chrysotila carterae TaxID=13221 RepID=A0A6T0CE70_CHRCT